MRRPISPESSLFGIVIGSSDGERGEGLTVTRWDAEQLLTSHGIKRVD